MVTDVLLILIETMAKKEEEIIKTGYMIKRSQNKKIYTPINYKQRWFVLNKKSLIYYDIAHKDVSIYILILFLFYLLKGPIFIFILR